MNVVKYFYSLLIIIVLFPASPEAQTLFRSGTFLHHSTGLNIWGPNGSATSIPQEMTTYNSVHGYTGTYAVTLTKQWWPSGGNNEWEFWHRIFDNQAPGYNIFSVMNNNKIVVLKSCFPSSEMTGVGQPSDTLTPTLKTIYNHKWHWRSIISVMASRPQNFFAIWTNAPHVPGNTNPTAAALAKQFTTWAKDTLALGLDPEFGVFPPNVYVFHYFSKLTDENGYQLLQYAISPDDSHPNATATALVAPQFVNEIFDASIAYEQSFSTLSVSPVSQNVTAAAGTAPFTVTSVNAWTAQSNAGWCTVTPSGSGNGTLTATYTANTETTSRTATITVSASGAPNQTVTLVQAGVAATLSVTPSTQNVSAGAGNTTFSVSSNTNWTAQSNAGWCTVTPSGSGNGTLTANYTANTGTSSRTATITVSATGAANQTVTVVQAGAAATLSVTPSTQNVTAGAGNTTFTVSSNTSWTAQSNAGWCTVTPSGSGNGTLTATYTANTGTTPRTATITVSATGASNQTVTVVQAGAAATLSVTPSTQNVSAGAGNTTFTVSSNTSWTAQSNAGWCTVTPSGSGNGTLTATYTANTGTTPRTATITVSATGASNQTVTVVQAGTAATLSVTPSTQNVTAGAGNTTFTVSSNTSWTAQSNAGWCTVTPSGTGNGTLTVTYTANTGTTPRTATITVSATGASNQTVTVVQSGATVILNVTPSNQNVPAASGSTSFAVTSNAAWTAQSNAGWCTVTPSGTGNGTLTASYTENLSTSSRVALITVSSSGANDLNVTVTQAGAEVSLTVNPNSQSVNAVAGAADFTVVSNTTWTAQSDAGWCTVTPSGNGNGTLTAVYQENTGTTARTAGITVLPAGGSPQTVTLHQFGSDPELAISPSNHEVSSAAGTATYQVTSNISWTAQSNSAWCTVTPSGEGNGELLAVYEQNTETGIRVAVITISAPGAESQSVTLTQSGTSVSLMVTPANQNVSHTAGNTHFSVASNTDWTAYSDAGWCSVTAAGSGNGTIIATVLENVSTAGRLATITVSATGVSDQLVTVYQFGAPPLLQVTPPGQQVPPEPGTASFEVTSNAVWSVHSDAPWCIPTPSGSGNGTILAVCAENHSTEDRLANLKVTAEGISPVFITVLQTGLITGVAQHPDKGIKIYPNPTGGVIVLDIENPGNQPVLVTISDVAGKVVYRRSSAGRLSESVDLTGFAKGLYSVAVSMGNSVSVTRILLR